jgi:two-component system response regulator QseB
MRILLVEDDELLGSGVSEALERKRYPHDWVRDGAQAVSMALHEDYDLILLDLGLPGLDGLTVLQRLRDKGRRAAVLVISARNQTRDRIEGLNLGADDYISKPFELDELLARIRAVERRMAGQQRNVLEKGRLQLSLDSFEVRMAGQVVDLQRREFMLLRKLVESPSSIHTRGQLEAAVYGGEGDVESNSIDVHVHHLRKKLGADVVKTIRGVGYRLGSVE